MPDVFGLRPFYQELAHRFAATGVQVLAIDLYGRTTEPTPQPRDETFDFWPHISAVQIATVAQDIAAGLAFLRTLQEDAPKALFTIGFCFGGATSFLQAAPGQGLAGVIGFYGPPLVTPPGRDQRQPSWSTSALLAAPCLASLVAQIPTSPPRVLPSSMLHSLRPISRMNS